MCRERDVTAIFKNYPYNYSTRVFEKSDSPLLLLTVKNEKMKLPLSPDKKGNNFKFIE
ncbi:hypothetical protein HMPREF9446_01818 [Bacteroides fluxus YIT 12057]|uniref:Uncharacterized protein n=1 Tax=Bacteroides fluxus YIT 12057 TaxID=763034 RepID=F3PSV6_9BACE|nr:hypothetical protein HMPREF9446_01818 [Bacteroides fluxus YIT 12057]